MAVEVDVSRKWFKLPLTTTAKALESAVQLSLHLYDKIAQRQAGSNGQTQIWASSRIEIEVIASLTGRWRLTNHKQVPLYSIGGTAVRKTSCWPHNGCIEYPILQVAVPSM